MIRLRRSKINHGIHGIHGNGCKLGSGEVEKQGDFINHEIHEAHEKK